MKNLIILLLTALLLPVSPTLSGACSGVRFSLILKEPKTNTDGTPLADLLKTTLFYSVNNGTVKKKDYTATSIKGGGSKSIDITIPMNCKSVQNNVKFWSTATAGSESASSNILNFPVPTINVTNTGTAGGS